MKKYSVNENYFNKIDTANKAYILGFLYADGNVFLRSKRQTRISIVIQERDKNLLNNIKKEMASNFNIKVRCSKNPNHQNYISLIFNSTKMGIDLINLGCVPAKSLIIKFPTERQVPTYLLNHFIRGYFDGDGSLYASKTGRHKNPQYIASFIGTFDFCNKLNIILQEQVGLNPQKIGKQGNVYRYCCGGNQLLKKLHDYLYENAEFYLERKREKFQECMNLIPYH